MIRIFNYKGTLAIEISNNESRVVLLPHIGGKVASFYLKDKKFELLYQNQNDTYREAKFGDDFSDYDTSGFDDCFPSIDKSIETIDNKQVIYPDHGEVWSSCFEYNIPDVNKDMVNLSFSSSTFSYTFEKSISLQDTDLMISYKITNNAQVPLKGFYTVHCLAKCEENMRVRLGSELHEVINVTDSNYLGAKGTIHKYPMTTDSMGNTYMLNRIFNKSAGKIEKYYATTPKTDGYCSLYYPNDDVTFSITYDVGKLPYIGFWVTEGGYKGCYNCALEPSSGYYDSMETALLNNIYNSISPGESFIFDLKLSLSSG